MSDNDTLRQNLQLQVTELEMLQSMFPKEFKYEDETCVMDLQKYLNDASNDPPPFVDFILQIKNFQLCVTFPNDYPDTRPDIYIRNAELNRCQASEINRDCESFTKTLQAGEPCVYNVILWLQDNAGQYTTRMKEERSNKVDNVEHVIRLWIYSHHIYNKTKRREILNLANQLQLTGFCLPGKPGVICVEGHESDCNQWWTVIRNMTWQKIVCKFSENHVKKRRFTSFEEVPFQTHGTRSNHSDLGELYKYLEQRGLEFAFKHLFGIEGGK